MTDTTTKNLFESNYVIEHIDVLESNNKKYLENPGGETLLNKYGGEKQGIPYYLIFNSEGTLLADSKMKKDSNVMLGEGENMGCPGTQKEVDTFLYKLKETSNLSPKELAIIGERFRLNNPN